MQDKIESEIVVNGTMEQVYEMIASPEKVVLWFPDSVEGNYAVGESPVFEFKGHGKTVVHILDAKPYEYFSYKWIPNPTGITENLDSMPQTLVEFRITNEGEGKTKVHVTESGFSQYEPEYADQVFKMNTSGWGFMLGRLQNIFV